MTHPAAIHTALLLGSLGFLALAPASSTHAAQPQQITRDGQLKFAPVFIDGSKATTLRGPDIAEDFQKMVADYIETRFGAGQRAAE